MKSLLAATLMSLMIFPNAFASEEGAAGSGAASTSSQTTAETLMSESALVPATDVAIDEIDIEVRRRVTCFAQNGRGQIFRATGRHPYRVQARAMRECYEYSRFCRELGCRHDRF